MLKNDPAHERFYIIPQDSIDIALGELNLDPTNPQYQTDMWKAIKKMSANLVITGYFIVDGSEVIINAFIFDVKFKMPLPKYQARDVRVSKKNVLEAITEISEALLPGIL